VRLVRVLFAVLLVVGGLGSSLLLASKAANSLHDSPKAKQHPDPKRPTTATGQTGKAQRSPRAGSKGSQRGRPGASSGTWRSHPPASRARRDRPDEVLGVDVSLVLLITALETGAGVLVIGLLVGFLTVRRVRMRARRRYALYELHLSPHDEAKAQDLEDMMESIANIVRAWPADRARSGQPYVAVELIYGSPGPSGGGELEWSINVRCQPEAAPALDAAISATYPDVRLGRVHAERPVPRPGTVRAPGHVLRFRKERSFIYPLIAADEALASPPLEQIALAQAALGQPSVVRFQLTPTPSFFEELARKLYKRRENVLVRQERWGLPEGGLWSTLNRAEMSNAQRTQNRSLFWLELVVAADSAQACKTIAAAVQSRRGENRLHRRWMTVRQGLYRRRFPHALGPLLPSTRSLVSAAEAAHLLALPSARMKGVPVRRLALPRIPAPPEVTRGDTQRPTTRREPPPNVTGPARSPTSTTTGATR
jgi:hypothetical protein